MEHPGLAQAVKGARLGGALDVAKVTQFVGVQGHTGIPMSITVLNHKERIGAAASLALCKRILRIKWGLA